MKTLKQKNTKTLISLATTIIFPPLVDQRAWIKSNVKGQLSLVSCQLLSELSLQAFKTLIQKTMKQSNNRTIVVGSTDVLFPIGPPPFLYLQSLIKNIPDSSQIILIFLTSQTPLTERLRKRFLCVPILFENIHYVPLDKNNLPFKNKEQAFNFLLLLNENQRRILRLLVRGSETIPSQLKPDQEYLEKTRIIKKHYGRWKLISSVLEKAALQINEGLHEALSLKDNKIHVGAQEITNQFSPQQKKLMRLLLTNKGQVVSREQIAESLWGKNWEERYSDWAIDQLISTLRKKLQTLWINPQMLVSKKKKGVSLTKQD